MISKSFLPQSIIEKLSHEKFNLHVSHDEKLLDTAEGEGEVPWVKEHGTSPSPSAVSNNFSSCETCKLNFSCDSFSIIDCGKIDFEITTIKEALHIKFKKPIDNYSVRACHLF